jgi:hypothetical protein
VPVAAVTALVDDGLIDYDNAAGGKQFIPSQISMLPLVCCEIAHP